MIGARGAYRLLATAAHRAETPLAAAWRWTTRITARDETAAVAARGCLVIAPHPDDETLGCGATIARKRAAGTPVRVVIVADGRYAQRASTRISPEQLASLRAEEARAACKELGVDSADVFQLGYEDNHVAQHEDELVEDLLAHLAAAMPGEVLVVSDLDHHPDHRAVNRAAQRALRRWNRGPIVREFAVWSWIDGPWLEQRSRTPGGRAVHLVAQPARALARGRAVAVRTGRFATAKRAALAAHATQTSAFTDEPEWGVMDDTMLSVFPRHVELFLCPRRRRAPLC